MALSTGARLGPYEITAEIGSGGMGVVYRAHDTRLQRDVAVKVLPDALANDPERLARFQREAQLLASLNHPNIAAIYGVEEQSDVVSGFSRTVHALVLELVEGDTLADRIARGPIPVDEALAIAKQIAEALEAAHEQGIVHRDLKPANIKRREDGTVKVLDFGLAKLIETGSGVRDSGAAGPTAAPTITSPAMMTGVGVLLGTAAYMSPEQAKGRPADKRSDVWAFGALLFEMLTAKRAFDGEGMTDTLAAIITKEPEWAALPADTPTAVRRLLRRCLERDRKRRLADIADARLEIEEGLAGPVTELTAGVVSGAVKGSRLAWSVAFALGSLLLVTLLSAITYMQSESRAPVYRTTLLPPPDVTLTSGGLGFDRILAISPNGFHVAFSAAGADGRRMLWVRRLDELSAEPLPGTEDAQSPFWSPDSRWIAFFADGQLKKVEAIGGPVLTLCRYSGVGGGGTWNSDGVVLFSDGIALHRVDETGGTPSLVMAPDAEDTNHQWPFFLPDEEHFLYRGADSRTYVASLDAPEGKPLDAGFNNAQYARGYLIWTSDGTLFAQRFDTSRLAVTDQPVAVAERVDRMFSVAQSGELVYQNVGPESSQLVWFDRAGRQVGVLGDPADYGDIELSPDGSQVAVTVRNTGQRDIWIVDVTSGVRTKFTFEPGDELNLSGHRAENA